jgi:hypothetical protein
MTREEICEIVHKEIDKLKIRKKPENDVPSNGIYFWYEEGENHQDGRQRIIYVGINESGNLRERIKKHFRKDRDGSSFRTHIGGAIMNQSNETIYEIKVWYKKTE